MAIDTVRIRVQSKRFLVIYGGLCYRLICKHPFLVSFACSMVTMYRIFPGLFAFLVSASPVLVCTALLLGVLLSYGEPNIPEIEKEKEEEEKEEVRHDVSSLRAGFVGHASVVVDRVGDFSLERVDRKATEEESLMENKVRDREVDDGVDDCIQQSDVSSRDVQMGKQVIEEREREFDDLELANKNENEEEESVAEEVLGHEKSVESPYTLLGDMEDQNLEDEDDKCSRELKAAEKVDSTEDLTRKRESCDDQEEGDNEDASSSGSDGGESSSPDASMADIIPMLDELHPLLDDEAPQTAHVSHYSSEAGSEESDGSKECNSDSEEDIGNRDDGEDGDDNENRGEEVQGDKDDDESKSAIKWTEDDQKNLMDLGTSELERNQRLESLIARRRARRLRMVTEKNLIDLDGFDLQFNVPPISTTRRNPFDFPYDNVPGSAPSILQPCQNPFDIPYESNEEKPDLKGDDFEEEFSVLHHEEPVFRRHESFSVRSSVFGFPKQERQDFCWKPIFVPEQSADEGTSFDGFQRQLSEISESKLSSVLDTESASSAVEDEDKKVEEYDFHESEMISGLDQASIAVQRGSLTSEDVESVDIGQVETSDVHQNDIEITLGGTENHHEADSRSFTSEAATPIEINPSEILQQMEQGEDDSRSSLSSLSEVDEKVSNVPSPEPGNTHVEEPDLSLQTSLDGERHFSNQGNGQPGELVLEPSRDDTGEHDNTKETSMVFESDLNLSSGVVDNNQHKAPEMEARDNNARDFNIQTQTSLESESQFSNVLVDENRQEEPVYDPSPRSIDNNSRCSSFSLDTHKDTAEMGSPPALAEADDNNDSEVFNKSTEENLPGDKKTDEGSLQVKLVEHSHSIQHDLSEVEIPGVSSNSGGEAELVKEQATSCYMEHRDEDLKPGSSGSSQLNPPEEKPVMELERQPSSSNSYTREPSDTDHGEGEEPSTYWPDFLEEVSIANNKKETEVSDPENNVLSKIKSLKPETADSSSLSPDSMEYKSQGLEVNDFFDKFMHVDNDHVLEHGSHSTELHGSSAAEAISDEEEKEAKEIDDGLLSELDTVGDFRIKELVGKPDEPMSEKNTVENSQSDLLPQELNLGMLETDFLSARSVEDFHLASYPGLEVHDRVDAEEVIQPHTFQQQQQPVVDAEGPDPEESSLDFQVVDANFVKDIHSAPIHVAEGSTGDLPQKSESNGETLEIKEASMSELPILEVKSIEDIDMAFKQLHGVANAEEVILASTICQQPLENDEDPMVNSSGLRVIDAKSLEDINITMKNVTERCKLPQKSETKGESLESNEETSKVELPVLEVKTAEDIDKAFKQLHEGADVEEVILPSSIQQLQLVENEEPMVNSSCLQVVDAKSIDDINIALKSVSEGNSSEVPPDSDSKGELEQLNEGIFIAGLPVLEIKTAKDIDIPFKQLHEGATVEEVILPSTIKQQHVENGEGSTVNSSGMQAVEANSLEDIHNAVNKVRDGNTTELGPESEAKNKPLELNVLSSTVELPVLEVKTTEDIDMAFKQLHEGANAEEVILPSSIHCQQLVENDKGLIVNGLGMRVVDAKSLEDINIAVNNVSGGITSKLPKKTDFKDVPLELNEDTTVMELPVIEVNTAQDIHIAFKQLHEGADISEVILPSMIEQQRVAEEAKDPRDLPLVEARSLEDIQAAINQASEVNIDKQPLSSDRRDKLEVNIDKQPLSSDRRDKLEETMEMDTNPGGVSSVKEDESSIRIYQQ